MQNINIYFIFMIIFHHEKVCIKMTSLYLLVFDSKKYTVYK